LFTCATCYYEFSRLSHICTTSNCKPICPAVSFPGVLVVHQTLLQQSTPTTWWCSSAWKPPPFPSKHNNGHYGQTVRFLFHQTRGHFSNN
jgi:hypothetical protein